MGNNDVSGGELTMRRLLSIILILCLMFMMNACNRYENNATSNLTSSDLNTGSSLTQSSPKNKTVVDVKIELPIGYKGTKREYIEEQNERFYAMDSKATSPEGILTRSYPEKELVTFINHLTREKYTTLYELDSKYPVEYIQFEFSKPNLLDFQIAHCAYKLDEGGYLYVILHSKTLTSSSSSVFGICLMVERVVIKDGPLYVNAFDSIKKGSCLADIEKIDKGTARLNAIRRDYLDAGCVYLDDERVLKYSLPGTVHIADGAMIVIVYEDPKDNSGEYIVMDKLVIDGFILSISEYFVDYDKIRANM